jgi:hypothetical protein
LSAACCLLPAAFLCAVVKQGDQAKLPPSPIKTEEAEAEAEAEEEQFGDMTRRLGQLSFEQADHVIDQFTEEAKEQFIDTSLSLLKSFILHDSTSSPPQLSRSLSLSLLDCKPFC